MIEALNWLDWLIVVIVFAIAVMGFFQGFINGLISLITWSIAIVLAYFFATTIQVSYFERWFTSQQVAFWLSFASIMIVVWVLGLILKGVVNMTRKGNLSIKDKLLGALLSALKAIMVISVGIWVLSTNQSVLDKDAWKTSVLVPYLLVMSDWMDHQLPQDLQSIAVKHQEQLKSQAEKSKNNNTGIVSAIGPTQ